MSSSISLSLIINGGATIIVSPTARMTRPLLIAISLQIEPALMSEENLPLVSLLLEISIAATKPLIRASPINGWSDSLFQRSSKYGAVLFLTCSNMFSLSIISIFSNATAQSAGCPE